jgi:hypothetical protein
MADFYLAKNHSKFLNKKISPTDIQVVDRLINQPIR